MQTLASPWATFFITAYTPCIRSDSPTMYGKAGPGYGPEGLRVPVAHLRPSRDARSHRAAQRVVGNGVLVQAPRRPREGREVRHRMRPRAHEVHLAAQDVDELGQLVEPIPPQPAAQARD